jgi:RNA polymerase sigma-70 factor (ECF subfamily)
MQQSYVNAYAHLRQFDGRASFATWLTRIAVHEAIARAKKRGRYRSLDEDGAQMLETMMETRSVADPEHQAFAGELRAVLEAAVDGLPDGNREVFVLREIQGLTTAETAASLGLSDDVVKTRLCRAKSALRRDLLQRAGVAAPNLYTFHKNRCDRVVAAVFARIA